MSGRNSKGQFVKSEPVSVSVETEAVSDSNIISENATMNQNLNTITFARLRQQLSDLMVTVPEDSTTELREQAVVLYWLMSPVSEYKSGKALSLVSVGVSKADKKRTCWVNVDGVGMPFEVRLNDKNEIEPFMTGLPRISKEYGQTLGKIKALSVGALRDLALDYWTTSQDHSFLLNFNSLLKTVQPLAGARILVVDEGGELAAQVGFKNWVYPTIIDSVPKDTYLVAPVKNQAGEQVRNDKGRLIYEPTCTIAQYLGVELSETKETVETQTADTAETWMNQ
jgi:hypothetical protein